MSSFLKVLVHNLFQGPSTDPFPFGETFSPKRVRGRVRIDPGRCMGCGMCRHVCAAGAIHLKREESGFTITVWQDSCCLCRSCVTYCPMGAVSIDNDWHSAHLEAQKFERVERQTVSLQRCAGCGSPMRVMEAGKAAALYGGNPELDPEKLRHLCRTCRRRLDAERSRLPAAQKAALSSKGAEAPATTED